MTDSYFNNKLYTACCSLIVENYMFFYLHQHAYNSSLISFKTCAFLKKMAYFMTNVYIMCLMFNAFLKRSQYNEQCKFMSCNLKDLRGNRSILKWLLIVLYCFEYCLRLSLNMDIKNNVEVIKQLYMIMFLHCCLFLEISFFFTH